MAQLNQTIEAARAASGPLLLQAQAAVRDQLAARIPLAAIMTFILTAVATLCTYFIWRNAGLEAKLAFDMVNTEKAKRRSRIEQLVDDLEAEELVELRSRLSDEDDIRPLQELMSEDSGRRGQR